MKKTIFWFLLLTVCATSAWWLADILIMSKKEYDQFRGAASSRQHYAESGGTIGIAAAGDWSIHPSLLNGISLAVEEINAVGGLLGRIIKLTPVDDKGNLEGAFKATQQICDATDTLFVIGHSNARLTQAVVQNYEFYGILMISPLSANMTQSQKNFRLIFSNSTSLDMISEKLLLLARQNQWSRIGMIYDASNFDTELAHLFESILISAGIKMPLLSGIYPDQGPRHLQSLIQNQSREIKIDAMVVATGTKEATTIIQHLRESGFDQPIILGREPEKQLFSKEQNQLKKIYWPKQINTKKKGYTKFLQSYLKRFGTPPDIQAVSGYDAVMVLADAVKKSQSLCADEVARTMKSFTPVNSLTGTLGFDSNGNAVKVEFIFRGHDT